MGLQTVTNLGRLTKNPQNLMHWAACSVRQRRVTRRATTLQSQKTVDEEQPTLWPYYSYFKRPCHLCSILDCEPSPGFISPSQSMWSSSPLHQEKGWPLDSVSIFEASNRSYKKECHTLPLSWTSSMHEKGTGLHQNWTFSMHTTLCNITVGSKMKPPPDHMVFEG